MTGYGEGLYGGGAAPALGVPAVADVAEALSKDVEAIQDAYDAEVSAQARQCRTDPYDPALGAALVRRIKRALAMANLPLGVIQDEAGSIRVGFTDPEIRRLEGPYRRVVLG